MFFEFNIGQSVGFSITRCRESISVREYVVRNAEICPVSFQNMAVNCNSVLIFDKCVDSNMPNCKHRCFNSSFASIFSRIGPVLDHKPMCPAGGDALGGSVRQYFLKTIAAC